MIIPLSHHHSSSSSQQQQNSADIFQSILLNSQDILNQNSKQQINRLRRYCQQKVYLSYCDDPNQYLLHMLHKSENQTKDFVTELIMNRESKVTTAIRNQRYQVRYNNDNNDNIKKIQDQLAGKLSSMKKNIDYLSTPYVKDKSKKNIKNDSKLMGLESEQLYNGYMEFRKKGYWNDKSEQSKKVSKFIRKMRNKRKLVEEAHSKNMTDLEKHVKQRDQSEKKHQEDQKKKIHDQFIRRRQKAQSDKKQKKAEDKKKLGEAESFLSKYKGDKPFYLLNEQKFKKQVLEPTEAEIKRKLAEIHKSKRPIDSEQMELHEQRYEQFRHKLLQAYQKKQQDQQIYQRNMQKLKQLFHGRFHQKIEEEQNSFKNILEDKRKQREKSMAYGANVKEEYKPTVDQKKREEVQKTIKLLQLKSQKGKKRILHGDSIILEDISPDQHKKIGISYLEHLRHYNEGKKRKNPEDRSSSMMQLTKKKIQYPNYLQQMRTKSRAQTARTNPLSQSQSKKQKPWMKVLSAQRGFSNRDKYNSVMDHVNLLQSQAKQKQLQLKYTKNGEKALQLKQKLDKYYLQSVEAKMHVLKNVILKQ